MNIIDNLLSRVLKDWETELQNNEWFFSDIRDSIISNTTEEEAFRSIPQLLEILMHCNDTYLTDELLVILMTLVRKSATTECPEGLKDAMKKIEAKSDLYGRSILSEIKNHYMLD